MLPGASRAIDTGERVMRTGPEATATARSKARKDLQHFGSPPTIPTACSDQSPVTSLKRSFQCVPLIEDWRYPWPLTLRWWRFLATLDRGPGDYRYRRTGIR
jgi:hypothetical protein